MASRIDQFGTPEAYNHDAVGWTHAMDTPYQWTKQVASHWVHWVQIDVAEAAGPPDRASTCGWRWPVSSADGVHAMASAGRVG